MPGAHHARLPGGTSGPSGPASRGACLVVSDGAAASPPAAEGRIAPPLSCPIAADIPEGVCQVLLSHLTGGKSRRRRERPSLPASGPPVPAWLRQRTRNVGCHAARCGDPAGGRSARHDHSVRGSAAARGPRVVQCQKPPRQPPRRARCRGGWERSKAANGCDRACGRDPHPPPGRASGRRPEEGRACLATRQRDGRGGRTCRGLGTGGHRPRLGTGRR